MRALEGALIRVVAYSSLTGRPITGDLAAEVLAGLYPDLVPARRTIREIQLATCEAFGVGSKSSCRPAAPPAWPGPARSPCTCRASSPTARSPPSATPSAAATTRTVLHAVKRTGQRIATDADAYETVRELTERLRTSQRAAQ